MNFYICVPLLSKGQFPFHLHTSTFSTKFLYFLLPKSMKLNFSYFQCMLRSTFSVKANIAFAGFIADFLILALKLNWESYQLSKLKFWKISRLSKQPCSQLLLRRSILLKSHRTEKDAVRGQKASKIWYSSNFLWDFILKKAAISKIIINCIIITYISI